MKKSACTSTYILREGLTAEKVLMYMYMAFRFGAEKFKDFYGKVPLKTVSV